MMKAHFFTLASSLLCVLALHAAESQKGAPIPEAEKPNRRAGFVPGKIIEMDVPLSDGKSFAGWDGETNKTWRIEDGAFVGGTLKEKVPHNEFLCSTRGYTNFVLAVKFKLIGTNGFINGGVQIRSKHVEKPAYELSGYQVDMGDPEWWGCLYDESRRNKVVAKSDIKEVNKVLKRQDWNEYVIRAEGKHIQAWLNGYQTVDYTEPDDSIPQYGIFGLQIHGGGMAEAWYKDIRITELP
jgi:hypothetical protein